MKIILKDNIAEVVRNLEEKSSMITTGTVVEMYRAMSILEVAIKQNIRVRSGLKVRSGSLLNSIQKEVSINGNQVTGKIGPENISYAATHEYGATIPARKVEPRHSKVLRWMGGDGKFWFSKGHEIPAAKIPARPYLGPAMDEKAEIIRERFATFITKVMEK